MDAAGRRKSTLAAAALLGLSALILAKLVFNSYWDAVWDRTTDAIGTIWLTVPVSAAIFCGALLAAWLPWKFKWTGLLYALLVPALMYASFQQGVQVDFRQLTAERAGEISRAIDAYYAREGRYPQQLIQLAPIDLLVIPDAVIMAGQTWCYLGGDDYYRLGVLDRDHWSSPLRYGRVLAAKGHLPQPVDVCQPAIDAYHAKYPGIQEIENSYFKPTPTLDLGE